MASAAVGLVLAHVLSRDERRDQLKRSNFETLLAGYQTRVEQLERREKELEDDLDKCDRKLKDLQNDYRELEGRYINLWTEVQKRKQNGGTQ